MYTYFTCFLMLFILTLHLCIDIYSQKKDFTLVKRVIDEVVSTRVSFEVSVNHGDGAAL